MRVLAIAAAVASAGVSIFAVYANASTSRVGSRRVCSARPAGAAQYVLDANRLVAHVVRVQQRHLLPGTTLNPRTNRLYLVTFKLLKPNRVIGRRGQHALFAYVRWNTALAKWCY